MKKVLGKTEKKKSLKVAKLTPRNQHHCRSGKMYEDDVEDDDMIKENRKKKNKIRKKEGQNENLTQKAPRIIEIMGR